MENMENMENTKNPQKILTTFEFIYPLEKPAPWSFHIFADICSFIEPVHPVLIWQDNNYDKTGSSLLYSPGNTQKRAL